MTDFQIAVARQCFEGSHDDTLSFPDMLDRLMEAGFEGYQVDYRRHSRTYFRPDGGHLEMRHPEGTLNVSDEFDSSGIRECIRWAQSGAPDYRYVEFNRRVTGFGCAGYFVSLPGRRAVYYGRSAEMHTEHFPS